MRSLDVFGKTVTIQDQGSRRDQINDKHMWHMNILALKLFCIKHNLLLQQNSRYILTLTTLLRMSSISYGSGTGGDYLCSRVSLLSELSKNYPTAFLSYDTDTSINMYRLGVSPNLVSRCLQFLSYLRTLSLKFQKARTRFEVFLA